MRTCILLVALAALMAPASVPAQEEYTPDKLKADLIGQTMGGREKCWKFQRQEQIEELVIRGERTEEGKHVYAITLKLRDPRAGGMYRAEAEVWYKETEGVWNIEHVGLRSLEKLQ